MSAEICRRYFSANRLTNSVRMYLGAHRLKSLKVENRICGVRSFKPIYGYIMPLQSISSEVIQPFRYHCFASCVHVPHSYRTYSSQKLGHHHWIFGEFSEKNSTLNLNSWKGYKTCTALRQADKEKSTADASEKTSEPEEKLSLFKRYKKMLKEYWYVLIPVHVATSLVWFGSFYYLASIGFDIIPFLEKLGVSETIISPLRNSSLGYIAVASALYKIATPARYMVTLGGTTLSINYLTKYGLLKPVPSKDKIKTMIQNKLRPQEKQTKRNS